MLIAHFGELNHLNGNRLFVITQVLDQSLARLTLKSALMTRTDLMTLKSELSSDLEESKWRFWRLERALCKDLLDIWWFCIIFCLILIKHEYISSSDDWRLESFQL